MQFLVIYLSVQVVGKLVTSVCFVASYCCSSRGG